MFRTAWWVLAAGFLVLSMNMGARMSLGLFIPDMIADTGWSLSSLSFSFGIQNLIWGAMAPVAGLLMERYGTRKILSVGFLVYAAGLAISGLTQQLWLFHLANGLLIGLGTGATTFSIVLAAVAKHFDVARRSLAMGIATAGGSFGQFVYALAANEIIEAWSWQSGWVIFAATAVLCLALVPLLSSAPATHHEASPVNQSYRPLHWLTAGFFVCGFHVALITVHMPNVVALCGLPPTVASNSIALIGLFNVVGTIAAGYLGGRFSKPWLLSAIYFLRSVAIVVYIFGPQTAMATYFFAISMGVLWLSTVPLTSGSVAHFYGVTRVASLFGLVMFSHQVGAFAGSWMGGWVFDRWGNYDVVWWTAIALGIFAALVHLPVRQAEKNWQAQAN